MSYRKKRLRKKLKLGEFREFGFRLAGKFQAGVSDVELKDFWRNLVGLVESLNFYMTGISGNTEFTFVIWGVKKQVVSEAHAQQILQFVVEQPGVETASAGLVVDLNQIEI